MEFQLPTYNRGLKLYFGFNSKIPIKIKLLGYDSHKPNTNYFDREVEFNGFRRVEVGLPISPEELTVNISGGEDYQLIEPLYDLKYINHKRINTNLRNKFTKNTAEFVELALWFSENVGTLPTGEYVSEKGTFTILLLPNLDHTPTRIEANTGIIEVSKSAFITNSIPIRVFKLLHEYSHLYKNRRPEDEAEADVNATKIFKKIGFPKVEAVYAITDLADTDYNFNERMMKVYNKL